MARILIVEDEPNLSCLYTEEWESEGHEVSAVRRGNEALRMLEEMPSDLVVFDLTLLTDEDLECLQEMRACHHGLKIIIYSVHPTFKQDFHSWCAERYLSQSSDLSELKETINERWKSQMEERPDLKSESSHF